MFLSRITALKFHSPSDSEISRFRVQFKVRTHLLAARVEGPAVTTLVDTGIESVRIEQVLAPIPRLWVPLPPRPVLIPPPENTIVRTVVDGVVRVLVPNALPEQPGHVRAFPEREIGDLAVGHEHIARRESAWNATRHADTTAADGVDARAVDPRVCAFDDGLWTMTLSQFKTTK